MNEHEIGGTDEISLLDHLVVIAESWVLLVTGTLLAAAVGYVFAVAQPTSYRTSALLSLPIAEAKHLLDVTGGPPETSDVELTQAPDEGTTQVTLTASSVSAAEEQLVELVAIYDSTLGAPLLEERAAQLRSQLAETETRSAEVKEAIARVAAAMDRIEAEPSIDGAAFAELAGIEQQLESERLTLNQRSEELQLAVSELPKTIVLSPPGQPVAVGRRSPYLIAALAGIAVGFVLLVFVFARHGVRAASQEPEGAAKLERIKRALLLRSRTYHVDPPAR